MALPSDYANLQGWWKADALVGLNDGDAVSTFTDQSGNSRNLTGAGGARPLYKTGIFNNYPALRFDGTDDVLVSAVNASNFISVGAGTIFVLGKVATVTTASPPYDTLLGDTLGYWGLSLASTEAVVAWNFDANADYAIRTTPVTDAAHAFMWQHSGGSVYAGKDAFDDASLTSTASGNVADLTSVLRMGAGYTSGAVYTAVDIAEAFVYSDAKDAATRVALGSYLASKYLGGASFMLIL